MNEFRHALRQILRRPGFALAVVLTLALGIGATTAIFSVFHAVLLKPLPYPQPHELVSLWESRPAEGVTHNVVSSGNYLDWYEQNEVFDSMGAYSGQFALTLTGADRPVKVANVRITPSLLTTLGVQPLLGHGFGNDGNTLRDTGQVLISHALWQSRFGGNPEVVGQTMMLEESAVRIAGVMPASFAFPNAEVQVWTPLTFDAEDRQSRKGHPWKVIARMQPGVALDQVRAHMNALADGIRERHPKYMDGWNVNVFGLHADTVRNVNATLWLVMAVVAATLLIACANVAGLMLARIAGRQHELSVRSALGAGVRRMAGHVFAESGVYALFGGAFGILLAYAGLHAIIAFGPPDIPRLADAELDAAVLVFGCVLMAGATLLVGLLPALSAVRANPAQALASGKATGGGRRNTWRRALIVTEVALACVLTVCAGLLVHSLVRVLNVDPGYTIDGVAMTGITLPDSRYPGSASQLRFYRQALERIAAMPAVEAVAGTAEPPVVGYEMMFSFVVEGMHRPGPNESEQAQPLRAVTPEYFRTLEIPLLRGRHFTASDDDDTPPVAIVSRAFAALHWPDSDAVGKRFSLDGHAGPWIEVVGVVGDTRHGGLDSPSEPVMYVPYAQKRWDWMSWLFPMIRVQSGMTLSAEEIRSAVAEIDPGIAVGRVRNLDDVYAESNARRHFAAWLLSGFGALALTLSMIGIYGVLAYNVAERQREFGIRMAVGGDAVSVLRAVLGSGLTLAAAGLVVGIGLALVTSRLLASQLFQVSAYDPLTFVAIPLLILVTALLASVVPALRAARVDPSTALRYE